MSVITRHQWVKRCSLRHSGLLRRSPISLLHPQCRSYAQDTFAGEMSQEEREQRFGRYEIVLSPNPSAHGVSHITPNLFPAHSKSPPYAKSPRNPSLLLPSPESVIKPGSADEI